MDRTTRATPATTAIRPSHRTRRLGAVEGPGRATRGLMPTDPTTRARTRDRCQTLASPPSDMLPPRDHIVPSQPSRPPSDGDPEGLRRGATARVPDLRPVGRGRA